MKTIKEVADTFGVSRQAIYRRLSALPSETLSTDNKGVQLINTDGEEFLKILLSDKTVREPSADNADSTADSVTDTLIAMLQKELDAKNKLIEEQQQTIRELAATNKSLSDGIKAERHNVLAETIIDGQKQLSAPATAKVSLWSKLFRRERD